MPQKITLTDAGIRSLAPPVSGQKTVWDKCSPLGVRVSHGGSKTFVVMLGSGSRHTIARVGVINLSQAREEARRLNATSSATNVKLVLSTRGATSTFSGTAYWSYGTCP